MAQRIAFAVYTVLQQSFQFTNTMHDLGVKAQGQIYIKSACMDCNVNISYILMQNVYDTLVDNSNEGLDGGSGIHYSFKI